jgi:putative glutamine amidotransferase
MAVGKSQIRRMPNLATWIRPKDAKSFRKIFTKYPAIKVWNARNRHVDFDQMDGLLLTGGADIAPEFLRQEVSEPSVVDKDIDAERDRWEFHAVKEALSGGLPILAICKGLQVFNVALGGTLKLDIKGHNLPEQKYRDVQPLRSARHASHRFEKVNSAHHQAIERLADDLEVEAWAAHDGIIEQVRLRKYPFGLAVQYHPERSRFYDSLFEDFFARLETPNGR